MKLPPYTKTGIGAAVILAAAAGLKLRLLPFTDAVSVAMAGASLIGIGIRHGVEKGAGTEKSKSADAPVTKESIAP